MKTWEVNLKLIFPATSATRCRYIDLLPPAYISGSKGSSSINSFQSINTIRSTISTNSIISSYDDQGFSVVEQADTFVCHCWGSRWGDLVTAVADGGADRRRRVWIDVFAVRQWPSNSPDLNYRSTIAHGTVLP